MANLSFYASEIDDILGRADKATAATALTSTDTLAGLTDGLYTATAEVASAISDSPVSVAFTLRVLADMYILILADGSNIYTGAPGSWHESSSGEDTTARTAIAEHIADKSNPHEVTKAQVGLGNVNNTSDIDKPVSTAMQAALSGKQDNLTFDTTPTSGSINPVTSGGLFSMFRNTVNRQSIINGTGDLNSAIISGFYKFNGVPENAPGTGTAAYGMLIVFDYDNYILQLCYRYDTQSLYVRHSASTGSSWGTWKELQLGS